MIQFDSIVLYVDNIETSKAFYEDIFDCQCTVLSPTFVSFSLPSGINMALKQRCHVSLEADITGGGMEISFTTENTDSLHQLYKVWEKKGVTFLQTPTKLVFGLTIVASDPDGHRIRIFTDK
ncbi:VOC family protein [Vibrio salinus]|uniref:VOC family protein n=1 Tax=Vibrio salinus TaxID=2899784 RepID=UPI001E582A23|nr:VOC family protein [Vibrio salinus]MCE0496214.1 VOC family protein [Vibrio salinus]